MFAFTVSADNLVDLLTAFAWPVVVLVVVLKLLPVIRNVVRSRAFTVSAGGMEISVQAASDQLASRLDDVRDQVAALTATGPHDEPTVSDNVRKLQRVLWVDDYPENNAFEMEALVRKGVQVEQARSTEEALARLRTDPKIELVITDMGREDEGRNAGLRLLRAIRESYPDLPVIIYASARAVSEWGPESEEAGATLVTSSATELMANLARLGADVGAGS